MLASTRPLPQLVQDYLTPRPDVRHVLTASQFRPDLIRALFERASDLGRMVADQHRHRSIGALLQGRVMHRLFEKESTRTYESFGYAGRHLGMAVHGTPTTQFSSQSKGETSLDTVRAIVAYYPDVLIYRSAVEGAVDAAAQISPVPIINAGDGSGEHPTQALLDLFTIQQEFGEPSGLTVVMGGDCLHGRTVRSLTRLLNKYTGNRIIFLAPDRFQIRQDILEELEREGTKYELVGPEDAHDALAQADIVYWTRLQVERYNKAERKWLKANPLAVAQMRIAADELTAMRRRSVLMHPLPRVHEISTVADDDPRAAYFRQMTYGMFVRMALLEWVLGY